MTRWHGAGAIILGGALSWTAHADLLDDIDPVEPTPSPAPTIPPPILENPSPTPEPAVAPTPSPQAPAPRKKKPKRARKPRDNKAEIHWQAVRLRAERGTGVIELEKDVVVTQEDLKLEADRGEVFLDPETNEVVKVIAKGNVKMFKTDIDPTERIRAVGDEAVFFNATQKVILKGKPKLWRGKDLVQGRQISYDLNTGWISADKVAGVVKPGQEDVGTGSSSGSTDKAKATPASQEEAKEAGSAP